jgi:hypothetical protein
VPPAFRAVGDVNLEILTSSTDMPRDDCWVRPERLDPEALGVSSELSPAGDVAAAGVFDRFSVRIPRRRLLAHCSRGFPALANADNHSRQASRTTSALPPRQNLLPPEPKRFGRTGLARGCLEFGQSVSGMRSSSSGSSPKEYKKANPLHPVPWLHRKGSSEE